MRYVCIHGHFYQPPRENAWIESVEQQDSAYPYHDWNERVCVECYAPNANSRILDEQGRIERILNNYSRISFNFGPTLMSWLESGDPETYQAILTADRESRERFGGHGSALAQPYSHPILPLCNARDKRTQVRWGIRDFAQRFGREPEGMWLPETAVDVESLEELARQGIRFTILAPSQAARVRAAGAPDWRDVSTGGIDPRRAYSIELPSARKLALFFYDGPISRDIAFNRLLAEGKQFAQRLIAGLAAEDGQAQLVHVATDGETYGHHHAHGDMALAFALHYIESEKLARITNYAEFLERHPAEHEARIVERSSWSCAHGIGRWKEACGCASEIHEGWHQDWRQPLREALDWLRDELAPRFERLAVRHLHDPWEARDGYIDVILDRSEESRSAFFERHGRPRLDHDQRVESLKLLELQRQTLLMYASCGWFFEELSRIETVQVLQYAGRAIHLAEQLFEDSLEGPFLERLEKAPSNVRKYGNGKRLYEQKIRPARVDMAKVGANFAADSLFQDGFEETPARGFEIQLEDQQILDAGKSKLAVGRIEVSSRITLESADLTFGFLHLGDHNLSGGVRSFRGEQAYQAMLDDVTEAFSRADVPEVIRQLDHHFLELPHSLRTLFRDSRRRILDRVLSSTLQEAEAVYRRLHADNAALMRFLAGTDTPAPRALAAASELVLNAGIRHELQQSNVDTDKLGRLLEEAASLGIELDASGLAYAARSALQQRLIQLAETPGDLALLERLGKFAGLMGDLPCDVDPGKAQNLYYRLAQTTYARYRDRADTGDTAAQQWVELFEQLGKSLGVVVPSEPD